MRCDPVCEGCMACLPKTEIWTHSHNFLACWLMYANVSSLFLLFWPSFVDGNFGQANVGFHFQIGPKDNNSRELQYSTAKAGIIGLTRTLALEGKKYNVFANVIAPVAGTAMSSTIWSVFHSSYLVHFNFLMFFRRTPEMVEAFKVCLKIKI